MKNEESITTAESEKVTQYPVELRDWFAGLAMQGMLADDPDITTVRLAHEAYHIADAMLKAREVSDE